MTGWHGLDFLPTYPNLYSGPLPKALQTFPHRNYRQYSRIGVGIPGNSSIFFVYLFGFGAIILHAHFETMSCVVWYRLGLFVNASPITKSICKCVYFLLQEKLSFVSSLQLPLPICAQNYWYFSALYYFYWFHIWSIENYIYLMVLLVNTQINKGDFKKHGVLTTIKIKWNYFRSPTSLSRASKASIFHLTTFLKFRFYNVLKVIDNVDFDNDMEFVTDARICMCKINFPIG